MHETRLVRGVEHGEPFRDLEAEEEGHRRSEVRGVREGTAALLPGAGETGSRRRGFDVKQAHFFSILS